MRGDVFTTMPMIVEGFLRDFKKTIDMSVYVQDANGYRPDAGIRQQKLDLIQACYEYKFNGISERYYKNLLWPHPDQVYPLVEQDDVFMLLYRELYFRHAHARLSSSLTLEQRVESYENYCTLFRRILSDDDDMDQLDLPDQWLWDMVDEFVYQFHDFCRFRSKDIKKRTPAELEGLAANTRVWDTMEVLSLLQRIVSHSEINRILKEDKADPDSGSLHSALSQLGIGHVQVVLGYFALVALSRVHVLCGDYFAALKAVEHLDLVVSVSDYVPVYMRVTSCYITLYYNMGFAYMMMRRYTDAVKTMTQVLLYINRTQHLTRPYQYEQVMKRSEQMYRLIAMCISLCPQRSVEDSVLQYLQDKYADQLARLSKGEEAMFEEFFAYAAPKAVYPAIPDYADAPRDVAQTLVQQQAVLLAEVRQQQRLPLIRSYLKLYTTISTAKLASFAQLDEPTLRAHLMCLKHKTHGLVKIGSAVQGPPLAGQAASSSNVDFVLEKGVVHVADNRAPPTFALYFIKHIHKLQAQVNELTPARRY
uniref:Eukaryotic translation initiation factor 3 subunit L n=1 Tax=Cryptomonas curvata TaxID=233186 RepID=A0A7S0N753_9CRYP